MGQLMIKGNRESLERELRDSKVELEAILEDGDANKIYKAEALQERITKLPILIRMAVAREKRAQIAEVTKMRTRAKRELDGVYPLYLEAQVHCVDLVKKLLVARKALSQLASSVEELRNKSQASGYEIGLQPNLGDLIRWGVMLRICDYAGDLIEPMAKVENEGN